MDKTLESILEELYTKRKEYKKTIIWSEEQERMLKRKILRAERIAKLEKLKNV